eukprot:scaffold5868_cov120-Isochrysis_galbana.AAC.8
MTSHNTQSTDHDKIPPLKQTERIRQRHTELGPGSGTNSRQSQTQTPRGVTVGTLKRGPPLRVRGEDRARGRGASTPAAAPTPATSSAAPSVALQS